MKNIKDKGESMHEPVFSYVPGISPLHKLDPRTKIVVVMLLGILVFRSENFAGIVTLFMLFFALALLSRLPMRILFRAVRPMVLFITFIFLHAAILLRRKPLCFILDPETKCGRAGEWAQFCRQIYTSFAFRSSSDSQYRSFRNYLRGRENA